MLLEVRNSFLWIVLREGFDHGGNESFLLRFGQSVHKGPGLCGVVLAPMAEQTLHGFIAIGAGFESAGQRGRPFWREGFGEIQSKLDQLLFVAAIGA